jgi:rubrerythrin
MKTIQFYDINLEKMSADELTNMFERIKEEIESHKYMNGTYPKKIHVYKYWLDMSNDKNPTTHLVFCI